MRLTESDVKELVKAALKEAFINEGFIIKENANNEWQSYLQNQDECEEFDRLQEEDDHEGTLRIVSLSERYNIAEKLIRNGYLVHCTNAVFNEFDKAYIKGGSRAHEGYGFYFTDMAYKAISYGDIFKIIKKDDFNFLNSEAPIDTSLFYKDNKYIEQQINTLEYYLDNCRNSREYDYYSNEIKKLESQLSPNDESLKVHIEMAIRDGAKTYGQLEYLMRNPDVMIPKIIKAYINNGYDGYVTDGIYTVFNFDKLNKYLIKDSSKIIYSLQQKDT